MKNLPLLLTITLLTLCNISFSNDKDELAGDYFHLTGTVYELNMMDGSTKSATGVHVVVYQEKEIFVAFFTESKGLYEFYLPIGHEYEIWFGGSAFINKKVYVDTRMMPQEKKPQKLDLDMGLFRPMDGYEFPILNDPYVMIGYDEELATLAPDLDYTEEKAALLEKQFKKIKKEMAKKK